MNELALFAGAGGGLLGSKILGWNTVCAVEIEPHARDILLSRQRDNIFNRFPIWDDIKTFDGKPWRGRIDIITGGFPCQYFSTANRGQKRKERNLWSEMARVVREVRPRYVFCENVSEGAIIKAGLDLWSQGYAFKYVKVSAKDMGADHIRGRWWLLAYAYNNGELCSTFNAKAQGLQKLCKGLWQSKPSLDGISDGVASRVVQNRAVGNGQMPAAMAAAFITMINN